MINRKKLKLTQPDADRILSEQSNCCIYCGVGLLDGLWYDKRQREYCVTLNWEHFVPYSFSQERRPDLTVILASCGRCNSIKGTLMFDTIQEARQYIIQRRSAKGDKWVAKRFEA